MWFLCYSSKLSYIFFSDEVVREDSPSMCCDSQVAQQSNSVFQIFWQCEQVVHIFASSVVSLPSILIFLPHLPYAHAIFWKAWRPEEKMIKWSLMYWGCFIWPLIYPYCFNIRNALNPSSNLWLSKSLHQRNFCISLNITKASSVLSIPMKPANIARITHSIANFFKYSKSMHSRIHLDHLDTTSFPFMTSITSFPP